MATSVAASVQAIKADFDHLFDLSNIWLTRIGLKLLPESTEHKKWFIFTSQDALRYLSYFLVLLALIFQAVYMINVLGNFVNFVEVVYIIPCAGVFVLGVAKIMIVSNNKSKLYDLVQTLQGIWPTNFNEIELRVVEKFMKPAQFITKNFKLLFLTLFWVWIISPSAEMLYNYLSTGHTEKILPFIMTMPFDTSSTFGYPVAYLFNMMSGFIPVIAFTNVDIMFVLLNTYICIQMKLVQLNLENIVERAIATSESDDNNNHNDAMEAMLKECVQHHNVLIQLSNILEEIYSPSILANFMFSSLIICCVGFLLLFANVLNSLKFVVFLTESLIQVFILCYSGNQLIETSSGMSDAVYKSTWYETELKFRRSLLIVMARALHPQKITAMKFSVLSLLSFSTILGSSYSYFTLIRTMYETPSD